MFGSERSDDGMSEKRSEWRVTLGCGGDTCFYFSLYLPNTVQVISKSHSPSFDAVILIPHFPALRRHLSRSP